MPIHVCLCLCECLCVCVLDDPINLTIDIQASHPDPLTSRTILQVLMYMFPCSLCSDLNKDAKEIVSSIWSDYGQYRPTMDYDRLIERQRCHPISQTKNFSASVIAVRRQPSQLLAGTLDVFTEQVLIPNAAAYSLLPCSLHKAVAGREGCR